MVLSIPFDGFRAMLFNIKPVRSVSRVFDEVLTAGVLKSLGSSVIGGVKVKYYVISLKQI